MQWLTARCYKTLIKVGSQCHTSAEVKCQFVSAKHKLYREVAQKCRGQSALRSHLHCRVNVYQHGIAGSLQVFSSKGKQCHIPLASAMQKRLSSVGDTIMALIWTASRKQSLLLLLALKEIMLSAVNILLCVICERETMTQTAWSQRHSHGQQPWLCQAPFTWSTTLSETQSHWRLGRVGCQSYQKISAWPFCQTSILQASLQVTSIHTMSKKCLLYDMTWNEITTANYSLILNYIWYEISQKPLNCLIPHAQFKLCSNLEWSKFQFHQVIVNQNSKIENIYELTIVLVQGSKCKALMAWCQGSWLKQHRASQHLSLSWFTHWLSCDR